MSSNKSSRRLRQNRSNKNRGGSVLGNLAAPAVLLLANQLNKGRRLGKTSSNFRKTRSSRKTRKHRRR